jgi:hypothetical protein
MHYSNQKTRTKIKCIRFKTFIAFRLFASESDIAYVCPNEESIVLFIK